MPGSNRSGDWLRSGNREWEWLLYSTVVGAVPAQYFPFFSALFPPLPLPADHSNQHGNEGDGCSVFAHGYLIKSHC